MQSLANFSTCLRNVCGIYCLIHRDSLKCYVGSSKDIGRRLKAHMYSARSGSLTCLNKAIREFGFDAFDIEILELCSTSCLLDRETFWIRFYNAASVNGFNTFKTATANYSTQMSEVTRARISAAHKGKTKSIATRHNMSLAQKGHLVTDSMRLHMAQAQLGKKQSPETVAKRVKSLKGRKMSVEFSLQLSQRHKGKVISAETRAKLSTANIGRRHTEATKLKISQAGIKRGIQSRLSHALS